MKVIIDTNVFVSGIFWSGPPYRILKAWKENRIQLVISQEIFEEYERVARILSKQFPAMDLTPILQLVTVYAQLYSPIVLREPVSRDPDDDKFIACALAAEVKLIISGDRDLLDISGYQGIEVILPAHFCKKLSL